MSICGDITLYILSKALSILPSVLDVADARLFGLACALDVNDQSYRLNR